MTAHWPLHASYAFASVESAEASTEVVVLCLLHWNTFGNAWDYSSLSNTIEKLTAIPIHTAFGWDLLEQT